MALAGEHQKWNAALAVAALYRVGISLRSDSVGYGLSRVNWPGRFEVIQPGVVLDGAHNPQAAAALAATWRESFPDVKPALVFSAVTGKDVGEILELLAPLASKIFFCSVDNPRALPVENFPTFLPSTSPAYENFGTFQEAFGAAVAYSDSVLVAGSLFLVGEARAFLTIKNYQRSSQ